MKKIIILCIALIGAISWSHAQTCTGSLNVTIEGSQSNAPLGATASVTSDHNGTQVSCNGASDGEITVTITGGSSDFNIAWTGGGSATNQTSPYKMTGLTAGTYSITVTDAKGCSKTLSDITITAPTAITPSTVVDQNVSCNGVSDGKATASATGGTAPYQYKWDTAANNQATAQASNLAAGTYTVTITDANNCTATATATITQPDALTASTAVNNNVDCNGNSNGKATASATGGTAPYNYKWDTAASSQTTAQASNLAAGTYTVTITDANSCTATATATITQPNALALTTSEDKSVSCNGGSDGKASVSVTGGTTAYVYAWSNSATTASITGLTANTYTVTVTDANGCTATKSVVVTEPNALTASTTINNNVACNGGSNGKATASGSGGTTPYTYKWDAAATDQTTAQASNLAAGTYTVTITDANNCTATATATITELAVVACSLSSPVPTTPNASNTYNILCNGGTGTINVSASGGDGSYQYSLDGGTTYQAGAQFTGVAAGAHTVTVKDGNGCTSTCTITLTQPDALAAGTCTTAQDKCQLGEGQIKLTATGGVSPYSVSYTASPTATNTLTQTSPQSISPAAGATEAEITFTGADGGTTYKFKVTDANGCIVE